MATSVVGLVALVLLIVAFAAARTLVVGSRPRPITYELQGDHVVLPATEVTRAPGSYGLLRPDGVHARIDAVIEEDANSLTRALGATTGGQLPPRGQARWVRDVYPTPAALGLAFAEVDIATEGGVSPAWVVPGGTGGDVWAVHLHGIRTTRSVTLPGVAALQSAGFTSLVPSWRGDSEGPPTFGGGSSLGHQEWRDVGAALEFAVSSGAKAIVLVGWSMGALVGSLVLKNSHLADRVVATLMVAPVTSWRAVLATAVRVARLPKVIGPLVETILSTPGICRLAGLGAPVRIAKLDGAASTVSVPTLVIHNPGDPLSPFEATIDFCDRNEEFVELIAFDHAPHAMEWNREPLRFDDAITTWAAEVVAGRRA